MNTQISNGSLIINGEVIPPSQANVLIALNETFGWVKIPQILLKLKEVKTYNVVYVLLNRLKLKGIVLYKSVPRTPKKVKGYWKIDENIKNQIKQQLQHRPNNVNVSKEFVEQAGEALTLLKQIKPMHLSMVNALSDLDRRNFSGLLLDDDVINELQIVYPEDSSLISPMDSVVDDFVSQMMLKMKKFLEVKEMFAISGAMRYPWSQEARMHIFNSLKVKVD